MVDSSGSVGRKNFEKVKQFCMNFISSWPVGPNEGRFGKDVITVFAMFFFYSSIISIVI